jgi:hypothetical protein
LVAHALRTTSAATVLWFALGAAPLAAQKLEPLPPVMPPAESVAPPAGSGPWGAPASAEAPLLARAMQAYETQRAVPTDLPPPVGYGPPPPGTDTAPPPQDYPPLGAEIVVSPDPLADPLAEPPPVAALGPAPSGPPGSKPGVVQAAVFNATWLPALGGDGFGQTDLETYLTLGFPCPTRDSPLVLTPGFETHFLAGPSQPALPEQLYDAYFQFRWLTTLAEVWGVDLAVTPGWHSDFEQSSSDALRITARGIVSYDWSPRLKLIGGLVYLDRTDVNFLPVGGVIWTPSEDWRWELLAPRPRIAYRCAAWDDVEHWAYLAGEFGGGSWAIEGPGGPEVLNAQDYRLLAGWERKTAGGINGRLELGYVFGRKYQFSDGQPDFKPDDTLLLRGGVSY